MAPLDGSPRASVLIIERDPSIRLMMSTLLRRAGFATDCVAGDDVAPALPQQRFDVIVRDLNLARRNREAGLQELERTAPELLQRTVIMTTAPAALLDEDAPVRPFAVLRKPFDIDVLVETVRQCVDRSRRRRGERGGDGTAASDGAAASVNIARVGNFLRGVADLRALLAREAGSARELLVRHQVRRTAVELAHVLQEAAQSERNRARAAVLRAAARAAGQLAGRAPASPLQGAGCNH